MIVCVLSEGPIRAVWDVISVGVQEDVSSMFGSCLPHCDADLSPNSMETDALFWTNIRTEKRSVAYMANMTCMHRHWLHTDECPLSADIVINCLRHAKEHRTVYRILQGSVFTLWSIVAILLLLSYICNDYDVLLTLDSIHSVDTMSVIKTKCCPKKTIDMAFHTLCDVWVRGAR